MSIVVLSTLVGILGYTLTSWGIGNRSSTPVRVAQAPNQPPPSWQPDPELAKQIVAEQQESREYFRRLAEGQITRFVVRKVGKTQGRIVVYVTAFFAGLAEEDFRAELVRSGGRIFLFATTKGSPPASVAEIGMEEQQLGERMLGEQYEHQSFMRELVSNRVSEVEIESGDFSPEKSVLEVTIHYRNGKTKRGEIVMEFVDGFWYLISAQAA